ncbi:DUF6262 family protein [Streptomyces scopuliridis]|uniref:DUF6262 family protein n=1 Tax=Streptomyces scopuliridis TaxID=452529 RepID=UPI0036A357EB
MKPSNTAAAIAARRAQTKAKLDRVATAIGRLRRDRGRVTVRAIVQRADVSAAFLYENADAWALVQNAVTDSRMRPRLRSCSERAALDGAAGCSVVLVAERHEHRPGRLEDAVPFRGARPHRLQVLLRRGFAADLPREVPAVAAVGALGEVRR